METIKPNIDTFELLERIADALESISEKQGTIANALLQLADNHGSKVPGPYL